MKTYFNYLNDITGEQVKIERAVTPHIDNTAMSLGQEGNSAYVTMNPELAKSMIASLKKYLSDEPHDPEGFVQTIGVNQQLIYVLMTGEVHEQITSIVTLTNNNRPHPLHALANGTTTKSGNVWVCLSESHNMVAAKRNMLTSFMRSVDPEFYMIDCKHVTHITDGDLYDPEFEEIITEPQLITV